LFFHRGRELEKALTRGQSQTVQPGASLTNAERARFLAYFGSLMSLMALCDPNSGLIDIPLSFILKNRLDLDAEDVSKFRLIASVPLYLSFLFGLLRDRWAPIRGDRGIIFIAALSGFGIYIVFAIAPLSR
jgi:hypothetical protein